MHTYKHIMCAIYKQANDIYRYKLTTLQIKQLHLTINLFLCLKDEIFFNVAYRKLLICKAKINIGHII